MSGGTADDAEWSKDPEPIKKKRILCNQAECDRGLHSFKTRMRGRAARGKRRTYRSGTCAVCGSAAVDWDRLDRREPGDTGYLIESLKKERVRHRFWTEPLEKADARATLERGMAGTQKFASKRVEGLSGPSSSIFRDGTQTPSSGDVVYCAQHATATCCRKCIEEWYAIDRETTLADDDKEYLVGLIMAFVRRRLPEIEGRE